MCAAGRHLLDVFAHVPQRDLRVGVAVRLIAEPRRHLDPSAEWQEEPHPAADVVAAQTSVP